MGGLCRISKNNPLPWIEIGKHWRYAMLCGIGQISNGYPLLLQYISRASPIGYIQGNSEQKLKIWQLFSCRLRSSWVHSKQTNIHVLVVHQRKLFPVEKAAEGKGCSWLPLESYWCDRSGAANVRIVVAAVTQKDAFLFVCYSSVGYLKGRVQQRSAGSEIWLCL